MTWSGYRPRIGVFLNIVTPKSSARMCVCVCFHVWMYVCVCMCVFVCVFVCADRCVACAQMKTELFMWPSLHWCDPWAETWRRVWGTDNKFRGPNFRMTFFGKNPFNAQNFWWPFLVIDPFLGQKPLFQKINSFLYNVYFASHPICTGVDLSNILSGQTQILGDKM